MNWTDESGNPLCECDHLWSNHYNKIGMYFCEAPDCACESFSEITIADRIANSIFDLEESEAILIEEGLDKEEDIEGIVEPITTDYDCEKHGKGRGSDCPTCFDSDNKLRGRYIP